MNFRLAPLAVALGKSQFDSQAQIRAGVQGTEGLQQMQQLAMIGGEAADQLSSGGDTDEHSLVKRPQSLHNLSSLVQCQLEAAGSAFARLHTGRNIHYQNPTVASGFGYSDRAIGVKESTDEEQQKQGLGEEQHAREKAAHANLVLFHLHPQHQGGYFDAFAPSLTQVDEDENAQEGEKRQGWRVEDPHTLSTLVVYRNASNPARGNSSVITVARLRAVETHA